MFDNSKDTCWCSDQGQSQSIIIDFKRVVDIKQLEIMFQGGFIAKNCKLYGAIVEKVEGAVNLKLIQEFLPKDKNDNQLFDLEKETKVSLIKLNLNNCIDFYGRITIYKFDVLGNECSDL